MTAAATIDVEERRTYIGASEAAAALGLSPWNDPIGLAMEKWGEREPKEASFRMMLGLLVEPLIGDLYRQSEQGAAGWGRKLRAGGSKTRRMKGHPWIGAHPDFFVYEASGDRIGLVQAKLSDEFRDEVPLHYRLQGIAEIAVTGAPWIDFAVLEARDFKIYRVTPEPGEVEDLVADLDDYWNGYIVPKILPPPSAASTEALHERYRTAAKGIGKLGSAAQVEKMARYKDLAAQIEALKEQQALVANELRTAIGSANFLEGDGWRATWSRWESDETDWKLVAESYRKLIEGFFDELGSIDLMRLGFAIQREAYPDGSIATDDALDTIEGLYTVKKPGHRLTVSAPKEDRNA